jgi:hypothetical protein
MKSQSVRIELEGVDLEVEYYFDTPYDLDEQQLETLRIESITTLHNDDITELMWHHREKISLAVYEALDLMQY